MSREEIIFSGLGGQGIILAGNILAKAAAIYEGKNATLTQDYGPEARGGSCRADIVISDSQISYPYVETPVVLVAMSQEAYNKYSPRLRKDALLCIDGDLVKPRRSKNIRIFSIPATKIAQELGRAAVANIVMLGFLTAVSKIVSTEAIMKSVIESVPKGTEELNTKAFEHGYQYGLERLKDSKAK